MSKPETPDGEFDQLLEYLRKNRGFDFTGYKRPSLMRRVTKRMEAANIESFPGYVDYLEVHPEEFTPLFNTILINVTSFFRDEETWKFLAESIVPRITSNNQPNEPIRIWSAGCASGEEAFSMAMIMAGALGKEEFCRRVKIYATDADAEALIAARQGLYSEKEVIAVPEALREKYFERVGDRYCFNPVLRRSVIFGRHDLIQDAPISRLDLLICRNTLMYFNSETQSRILARFNYAINPGGFLFLGKAEMLLLHSSLYEAVDLKHRIFCRTSRVLRERNSAAFHNQDTHNNGGQPVRLRDAVFDGGPAAQVIVDTAGNLVMANQQARELYNLDRQDMGRPFQDFELSYRPAELRSPIDQAYSDRKIIALDNLDWTKNGEAHSLDITIHPLQDEDKMLGVCITFNDVTQLHKLEDDVRRARQEAETSNEELQTTNEELQSTNEELQTTNEELQSTNEELETTNEELQSSNEELETMNEEMQSTNEELQTINDELRQRTDELNQSNAYLNSILASLRGGVAVVDTRLAISMWNSGAEDLWGLRFDEVKGHSLVNLDIGLPVGKLRNPLQACLADGAGQQELILDAVNRRGRKIKCRISINPLANLHGQRLGAIIMMEEMGM